MRLLAFILLLIIPECLSTQPEPDLPPVPPTETSWGEQYHIIIEKPED